MMAGQMPMNQMHMNQMQMQQQQQQQQIILQQQQQQQFHQAQLQQQQAAAAAHAAAQQQQQQQQRSAPQEDKLIAKARELVEPLKEKWTATLREAASKVLQNGLLDASGKEVNQQQAVGWADYN